MYLSFYTLNISSQEEIFNVLTQNLSSKIVSSDLVLNGAFIFQAIVVLVNIKLFIQTNTHSWFSILWIVWSIGSFYFVLWLLSQYALMDTFSILSVLSSFMTQYTLLFFFTISYILIEYGILILDDFIKDAIDEYNMEERVEAQEMMQTMIQNKQNKISNYTHMGFAFDGAAGHDTLVTDRIFNRLTNAIQKQMTSGPSILRPINFELKKKKTNSSFAESR